MNNFAQTESGQKLSIEFFKYAKDCYGKFGHKECIFFLCTWGTNEKVGMNEVKLEKYFIKTILPLYPDVEDVAKKGKY